MPKVYIGLGANIGAREGNIRHAITLFREYGAGRIKRVSTLFETEPVGGPPGQRMFLNGAALIDSDAEPMEILSSLKDIEERVGRIARERWGPREIDLDILFYGDRIISMPGLEIPHPRICERGFVLRPLCEIAPKSVHPVTGKTIKEHLDELKGLDNDRMR